MYYLSAPLPILLEDKLIQIEVFSVCSLAYSRHLRWCLVYSKPSINNVALTSNGSHAVPRRKGQRLVEHFVHNYDFISQRVLMLLAPHSLDVAVKTARGQTLACGLRWAHCLFYWNTALLICLHSLWMLLYHNDNNEYLWQKLHSLQNLRYLVPGPLEKNLLNSGQDCLDSSPKSVTWDFPGGAVVKNPPANAGDTGSSPGPGRSHMPWSN